MCAAAAGCSGGERVHHALRQLEHGGGVASAAAGILLEDRRLHEGKQLGRGCLRSLAAAGGRAAEQQAVERAQVVRRLELERVREVLARLRAQPASAPWGGAQGRRDRAAVAGQARPGS